MASSTPTVACRPVFGASLPELGEDAEVLWSGDPHFVLRVQQGQRLRFYRGDRPCSEGVSEAKGGDR